MIKKITKLLQVVLLVYLVLHVESAIGQLKHQNKLTSGIDKYELIIKFKSNAIKTIDNNKLILEDHLSKTNPTLVKQFGSFEFEQIISSIKGSKKSSKSNLAFDMDKFKGLVIVKEASQLSKNKALELAKELESYSFIEYVTLRPHGVPPIPPGAISSTRPEQNSFNKNFESNTYFSKHSLVLTPNFTDRQDYLENFVEDDVFGINISYARSVGIFGQGIKAADVEWGFDYNHEDLKSENFIEQIEGGVHDSDSHGTAVAGILIGKDNGFGILGAVHKLEKLYGVSHYGTDLVYQPEQAILEAVSKLDVGDVLILEMQGLLGDDFMPIDIYQSIWDIIKTATDAGIIVVEAAGNGGVNLNNSEYDDFRNRGDNGVIRVGAGTRKGRNKLWFSNYGSMVDVQAWGEKVVTTGPIENIIHNGGVHATYSDDFSGTSSATAIVAAAAISLQSFAKDQFGDVLSPKQVKEILISTATSQGSGGHIGPLPNLEKAFKKLVLEVSKIPTFTLPNNSWRIISLPLDPGVKNKVSDILADDISGEYGVDWKVFGYNSNEGNFKDYSLDDVLKPGIGYWINQRTGSSIVLDMPISSMPIQASNYSLQLIAKKDAKTWNMIGNPFASVISPQSISIHTSHGGCTSGCDLDSAKSNTIIENKFWSFNGSSYDIKNITNGATISPWEGFWTLTLEKAFDNNSTLKFSKPDTTLEIVRGTLASKAGVDPKVTPPKFQEIDNNQAFEVLTKLYPNPTDGIVNFDVSSIYKGEMSMQIVSLDGRVIENLKFKKDNEVFSYQLDFSNKASGIYVIYFEAGSHHSHHKILIR